MSVIAHLNVVELSEVVHRMREKGFTFHDVILEMGLEELSEVRDLYVFSRATKYTKERVLAGKAPYGLVVKLLKEHRSIYVETLIKQASKGRKGIINENHIQIALQPKVVKIPSTRIDNLIFELKKDAKGFGETNLKILQEFRDYFVEGTELYQFKEKINEISKNSN